MMGRGQIQLDDMAAGVLAGNRRAAARAITLIESTRDDHRKASEDLLAHLMPHTGKAVRIGFTGIPGVGKSTLIGAFGLYLLEQGHRPAVLAVDPSSPVSGGSILGDKTRMEYLSRDARAFIRPSPSGCTLGGVARRTREAMLVCEAAGHDVIIIETVGVGQSETAVAGMVDTFVLLVAPGAGDELQGIKKGIVELADMIVVTKADGDLAAAAQRAARDYGNALHLLGRRGGGDADVDVVSCSSATGQGIDAIWSAILRHRDQTKRSGSFDSRRANQAKAWMWDEISDTLITDFKNDPRVCVNLELIEPLVSKAEVPPGLAARRLVDLFKSVPT
jgi:LAO/AO transport system kinase